jgi:hypothetical protein
MRSGRVSAVYGDNLALIKVAQSADVDVVIVDVDQRALPFSQDALFPQLVSL